MLVWLLCYEDEVSTCSVVSASLHVSSRWLAWILPLNVARSGLKLPSSHNKRSNVCLRKIALLLFLLLLVLVLLLPPPISPASPFCVQLFLSAGYCYSAAINVCMQHWWPRWTFVTAASSSVVSSKINMAFQTEKKREKKSTFLLCVSREFNSVCQKC